MGAAALAACATAGTPSDSDYAVAALRATPGGRRWLAGAGLSAAMLQVYAPPLAFLARPLFGPLGRWITAALRVRGETAAARRADLGAARRRDVRKTVGAHLDEADLPRILARPFDPYRRVSPAFVLRHRLGDAAPDFASPSEEDGGGDDSDFPAAAPSKKKRKGGGGAAAGLGSALRKSGARVTFELGKAPRRLARKGETPRDVASLFDLKAARKSVDAAPDDLSDDTDDGGALEAALERKRRAAAAAGKRRRSSAAVKKAAGAGAGGGGAGAGTKASGGAAAQAGKKKPAPGPRKGPGPGSAAKGRALPPGRRRVKKTKEDSAAPAPPPAGRGPQ